MKLPVAIATSLFLAMHTLNAQEVIWTALPEMPEPVSNNAVAEGFRGDTACIYSFTGIGSGLAPVDIHLKAWVYNSITQAWSGLPDVPDTQGKIAAGASYVDGVIYLMGGYAVNANFTEITSPKVHRFDIETHTWLSDGAPMPVPVDDQVQVVWRDSLIYTITGWSNSTNVSSAQVYNPTTDSWSAATPVPSNNSFRAFGASGTIVGDTIYYYGGTQINPSSFVANSRMRKGVISPGDPTQIEWSLLPDSPLGAIYRSAASAWGNRAFWLGGAAISYNFDGLAYSNGAGVEPQQTMRFYNTEAMNWLGTNHPEAPMDMRGIAKWSADSWAIAGGMLAGQAVTAAAYRLEISPLRVSRVEKPDYRVLQFAGSSAIVFSEPKAYRATLYTTTGGTIAAYSGFDARIDVGFESQASGLYILNINREGELPVNIKLVHSSK